MPNNVLQHFRCPNRYLQPSPTVPPSEADPNQRGGANGSGNEEATELPHLQALEDALRETLIKDRRANLPIDISEIVEALRYEQYTAALTGKAVFRYAANRAYYALRPLLPVAVRKHLQQLYLTGWKQRPFPHWPVDCTVEHLLERSLLQSMRSASIERVPFIWFWPGGAPSCAIVTHDIETRAGRDFCGNLMDIDDSFGIKSSFQVVPERRYEVSDDYLKSITGRGFEVALQDLNHDGLLYRNRREFLQRVHKINAYGRMWGAEGFRAAILYRKQEWFGDLDFSYDMSVPNVAHLDPQRGGCCTVMPYFIGKILELPVTATQDYTLFHILKDYSLDLWKRQIELIMGANGLISFIVHPDYVMDAPAQSVYRSLLAHLVQLRDRDGLWITTPGQVNQWWRQRAQMNLVEDGDELRVEGPGSERARIAYATKSQERLTFTVLDGCTVPQTASLNSKVKS
jgi:hypothetical protein